MDGGLGKGTLGVEDEYAGPEQAHIVSTRFLWFRMTWAMISIIECRE